MILLDAYAARSCPVKTQHSFDPLAERPEVPEDHAMTELFAGAQAFKDEVLAPLALLDGAADLRSLPLADREQATRDQVEAGAPVILSPRLPLDPAGHRRGSPDVLVRGTDREDGRPGYLPVQVKRRRLLENQHMNTVFCWLSTGAAPGPEQAIVPERCCFRGSREKEAMQVAHYWRLLDDLGWVSPGVPLAGLIGTDEVDELDGAHPLIWLDLTHKFIRTFSRTAESGWKRRSALERYDHEFGFRVKVAQTAQQHTEPSDRLMVSPIVTRECQTCQWWSRCEPELDDRDLSVQISKSPLDVREISQLRKLGIATIDELITADIDALLPDYLPQVQHRAGAEDRLRLAARRAHLINRGVMLDRLTSEPITMPVAELEIDFDIETSSDDRVYLWGFWVDDRTTDEPAHYRSFVHFGELDDAAEAELATQAVTWLADLVADRQARIYHYSDYELIHLRKLATAAQLSAGHALLARPGLFVDLFTTVRDHFFGSHGLGLKVVATHGAGFSWRDPDPSGLASQKWFSDACTAEDPAERQAAAVRVLEYNEDDVKATHALRTWLRSEHGAH